MKRFVSTALAVFLLLGLAALAVLARPNDAASVTTERVDSVALQTATSSTAASAPVALQPLTAPAAPAAGSSKFNWLALPLSVTGLNSASDLKTHLETNSSAPVTVSSVQQWNSVGQNYQTYTTIPFPSGNFSLTVGGVYRISISGNSGISLTWSMVGDVPATGTFTYTLRETAGPDFNWIMLPLDRGSLTMASQLKTDIEAHSQPPVTVLSVQQWNATAQNYQTYTTVPFPTGDFSIRIGYPYRISVDVSSGSTSTWPQ